MALYSYDGPYEEVEVRVAGHDIGVCVKGGSIVVPDELADSVEWQDYWSRADESPARKELPAAEPVGPDIASEGN